MKEILFRGKDFSGVVNYSWCVGSLDITEKEKPIIIYPDKFGNKCKIFVDPKTVGQYTGLTDKNGNKIFEGDVVKHTQIYDILGAATSIGIIEWSDSYAGWLITNFSNNRANMFLANEIFRVEKIGNIHDNPELLTNAGDAI